MNEKKIKEMIFDAVTDIIIKLQEENDITDGAEPFDTNLDHIMDELKDEIIRTVDYQLFVQELEKEGDQNA